MKDFLFNRYDVWLVDWRTSCNLPLTQVESKYSLDDCAAFDYPAAIDKVLEVTNKVRHIAQAERCKLVENSYAM